MLYHSRLEVDSPSHWRFMGYNETEAKISAIVVARKDMAREIWLCWMHLNIKFFDCRNLVSSIWCLWVHMPDSNIGRTLKLPKLYQYDSCILMTMVWNFPIFGFVCLLSYSVGSFKGSFKKETLHDVILLLRTKKYRINNL